MRSRRGGRPSSRPSALATRPQAVAAAAQEELARAQRQIEGLEGDVEAARAEVFAALNTVTALQHAVQHASQQHDRVGETLSKLDVEHEDLRRETEKVEADRAAANDAARRARTGCSRPCSLDRAARESELATARSEHEARTRDVRVREQELAATEARLASLEELASTRGDFGDAARMVLVQANGHVGQQGAVADYLEVDRRYERAVEACLGELLQHVIVERHDQAAAGLSLVREHDAGRCGFVVIDPGSNGYHPREALRVPGIVPVTDVMRLQGPHVVDDQQGACPKRTSRRRSNRPWRSRARRRRPVATLDGDVLRGPHLVSGGAKVESRGILATRARDQGTARARGVGSPGADAAGGRSRRGSRSRSRRRTSAIAALVDEQHRQEKDVVGSRCAAARAAMRSARGWRRKARGDRARARPRRRGAAHARRPSG